LTFFVTLIIVREACLRRGVKIRMTGKVG
jgi:hypothetical protein